MRRWWIFFWVIVLLICISLPTVSAAPPPSAVKQAKQEAPLHVVGVVTADVSVRDESARTKFTSETRKMTLAVHWVITNHTDKKITQGDALDVYYLYYPPNEQVTGPARVSVMAGDLIEIWLKKGPDGWMPALAGDTITPLKQVEPRREPGESFRWQVPGRMRSYVVGTIVVVVTVLTVGEVWRRRRNRVQ